MTTDSTQYLTMLHKQIDTYFDMEGVKMLCFELGIDRENIAGETRSAFVRNLILTLARKNRLQDLVYKARLERPFIPWQDLPADFALADEDVRYIDHVGDDKIVHGDEVRGDKVVGDKVAGDKVAGDKNIYNIYSSKTEPEKPPLPFDPPPIVPIPAGSFTMGSEPGAGIPACESPPFELKLAAYHIGKRPVSNYQYYEYLRLSGQFVPPNELGWAKGTSPSPEQEEESVCGVTWHEALAYCQWLARETGRPYALPSEGQWERAAREPEDPYGMLEGIREWTSTVWGDDWREPNPRVRYPWRPDRRRDDLQANVQMRRVTRGGSVRPSERSSELPGQRGLLDIGFRVVINEEV